MYAKSWLGLFVSAAMLTQTGPRSGSIVLAPDGRVLVVVNPDSNSVSVVETSPFRLVAEIAVGKNPQAVGISPDGGRAYVTGREDDSLTVVDLTEEKAVRRLAVGDEPAGVVVGSDRVYMALSGSAAVQVIDSDSLQTIARIPTDAEPRGLALSSDGARLYVTHFSSGRLTVIDTLALRVENVIATTPDANLSRGILLDEAGGLAYLPQTRSNSSNQALLFDGTVFPVVSVVDVRAGANLPARRISLDIADRPVNLPMDAVLSAGRLYVINAGSDDLSVIDLATGRAVGHVDLGSHPTGIALSPDGTTLYVNNTMSGTVWALDAASFARIGEVAVTRIPLPPEVLRGKILFSTSALDRISRERWISCATCHFEGGMDGRTWFFPDGPRNTTSLLGLRDTLPMHWSGDLDELQDVEGTIRRIQAGTGLATGEDHCSPACDQAPPNARRSQDLDDLAAFLASLDLSPNPNLGPSGRLRLRAERGRAIFMSAEAACASCHVPPLYTDLRRHDVGTFTSPFERKGSDFDTPSLRGIYKTAPYLHDGSAATLLDVLTNRNPNDRHGRTSQLTDRERADLVEFLRSLPFDEDSVSGERRRRPVPMEREER